MPLLTEGQLELIDKILAKLKERSSISAYVVIVLSLFDITDSETSDKIIGTVAMAAGVLLFLLNDATVRRLLTGAAQPVDSDVIEPSVPETNPAPPAGEPAATVSIEETTMSKLSAYFAVIKHAADAVLTAEVSAPTGSTGADKLDIAKSALEAAYPELGIADVAFETVWPLVKPFIDALVAKFKATKVVETSAPVAATAVATNPT